ncbi:unnamed protein product [Ceutorhynchus assimilis]|uniref:Uncharacterized protein n=1 Tax=Ceutorhynchus assimilis TaxID=467358 RepID=A0A9N9QL35_9CUCU|nr:unnamed protein product [Ceutorhynchus assimilis]
MCDKEVGTELFKSCFARSVAVNSQYNKVVAKNEEVAKKSTDDNNCEETRDNFTNNGLDLNRSLDSPVRYRKNNRSTIMDDSRRFSCGSIVYRRSSITSNPKRNEIPVENIYNQNKIDTLQWQLKETEKSRVMYKAVLKQIMTFLEKAHVSLEHLNTRNNSKTNDQSWTPSKKPSENNPEEIPPDKLSQEAFRLLRTAESLLNTQEPNLTCPEASDDVEFLAQLAKEFPSSQKPQRTTSFSVSPKLISPEHDSVKISKAFNRKLSLQLSEIKRRNAAESECFSLQPQVEKASTSPATASISSMEDESGFSSLNSFQEIGLPLVNSTAIEDVSARSVLLKSMLHNDSSELQESTLTSKYMKKYSDKTEDSSDVKLWQKPELNVEVGHKRWNSTPERKRDSQSLKVLWV